MTGTGREAIARRALACLDLTDLGEDCTPADIDRLCVRALSAYGPVAAVCIRPRFVKQAKAALAAAPVRVATVVNFPRGDSPPETILAETRQAIADGADEIDMVIPWRLVATRPEAVSEQIRAVREAAGAAVLKAILETGELKTEALIRSASGISISAGADFLKTSTGKVRVNATPGAARIMLSVIAETGSRTGFKAAGGIRTLDDAAVYLGLADEILGAAWAGPATFRLGASGLLDVLLAALGGGTAKPGTGY